MKCTRLLFYSYNSFCSVYISSIWQVISFKVECVAYIFCLFCFLKLTPLPRPICYPSQTFLLHSCIYLFIYFCIYFVLVVASQTRRKEGTSSLCWRGNEGTFEKLFVLMDYLYMKSVALRRSFATKNSYEIVNISIYR